MKNYNKLILLIVLNLYSIAYSQKIEIYSEERKNSEIQENEKTLKLLDKQIEKTNNNANLYFERGRAKGKLGNFNEAIDDFTQAIKIDSTNAKFYIGRGIAKELLEDYNGALNDYTIAKSLKENDKDLLLWDCKLLFPFRRLSKCYIKLYQTNRNYPTRLCFVQQ
ncbi:MAG: tetratricopeptide repeat protein [Bacteroidota bacterium]